VKFTQTLIESLKCSPDKPDMLVFDDEQRGLGVGVTAGGGKTRSLLSMDVRPWGTL
jgi:hypothetical protein